MDEQARRRIVNEAKRTVLRMLEETRPPDADRTIDVDDHIEISVAELALSGGGSVNVALF